LSRRLCHHQVVVFTRGNQMSEDNFGFASTVADLTHALLGRKVRVVGKLLSYDPTTQVVLLAHQPHGILVDINLCLDASQSLYYLHEKRGTLMVLGTLEHLEFPMKIPTLSRFSEAPLLNNQLILRAIMVKSTNDINLEQWRRGVMALRQT